MSPQDDNENQIIRQILAGERSLYAKLVASYQGKVLSHCLSLLRNRAEAEDAAQDIFVKAYDRLTQFRFEASFSTWLFRISRFHCLDLLKSKRFRKTESLDAFVESKGEAQLSGGEDDFGALDRKQIVQDALGGLSPEYQMILTLREVQGFTYDEMAVILETSLDGVKARLRRARKALQERGRHILPASVV